MKVFLWLIFLIFPPEEQATSPGFYRPVTNGPTFFSFRNDKVTEPAKPLASDLHCKTIAKGRSLTICKSQRNKISPPLYQPSYLNLSLQTGAGLKHLSGLKPGGHFTIYQLGKNNFELPWPMDSCVVHPLAA